MSALETAAVLVLIAATVYGLALLIYWPIAWAIRRHQAEQEYRRLLRDHAVYRSRPKDHVL